MADYCVRISIDRRIPESERDRSRGRDAPQWIEESVTTATLTFEQWQSVQSAIVEALGPKAGGQHG